MPRSTTAAFASSFGKGKQTATSEANKQGSQGSRLRQRKFDLVRRFPVPDDLLPGSLSLSHLRCGKPTCHCADGPRHPVWSLTFMVHAKKHVQHIPKEWVEDVRQRVEAGREFQAAVREVLPPMPNCWCWLAGKGASRGERADAPSPQKVGGEVDNQGFNDAKNRYGFEHICHHERPSLLVVWLPACLALMIERLDRVVTSIAAPPGRLYSV